MAGIQNRSKQDLSTRPSSRGSASIKGQHQVHFLTRDLRQGGLKAGQLEEQETLGKGKVLAQIAGSLQTRGRWAAAGPASGAKPTRRTISGPKGVP